ncbi:hypothetical protein G6011_02844 [Alternaria panax]|uniref:Uncharacterized protein n=1 Tax=Alternaria panax TaxID=48097 RepID=A0AAD4FCH9_9PLEO|nr:hypothetical protein G6011_02844 [Alternaria panax]
MRRLASGKLLVQSGLEGFHPASFQLHTNVSSQPLQAQLTGFTAHLVPRSHLRITAF